MIQVCLNCGCGRPAWRHNSNSNITQKKLKAAANAAGPKNLSKAAQNINKTEKAVKSGKISPKLGAPKNSRTRPTRRLK